MEKLSNRLPADIELPNQVLTFFSFNKLIPILLSQLLFLQNRTYRNREQYYIAVFIIYQRCYILSALTQEVQKTVTMTINFFTITSRATKAFHAHKTIFVTVVTFAHIAVLDLLDIAKDRLKFTCKTPSSNRLYS